MVSRKTATRRRRTLAIATALVTFSAIMFTSCGGDDRDVDVPNARDAFIEYVADAAQASQDEYGVPSSVAMAQAILESDWGRSKLTREGFAFFGIKCSGSSPHSSGCAELPTTECDDSGCHEVVASFRTYDSAEDSFADHGHLLATSSRYEPAFDYVSDPKLFATTIANAGYATDPSYAEKVISLMDDYNLYQYDTD